ncbi:hypothetical protein BJ322DRAFT_606215 [Thelephora terrestris]|uniref:SPIN90/Ldb17 leucine-rich domain-containing protein n=1 Tax=Thelephora terrestris TaxID=56493 RepID=A0A9P6HJH2_9AGAM|nr:hypothetical protein BJ322DRAFT_606215 [Thelephora terrestris]
MDNSDFDFGIVYLIENAQQFWSELEDILHLPSDPTLSRLDSTLKRFVSFCASYHEQYLQTSMQLEHACELLLHSELFAFHSERMCDNIVDEVQKRTDPHLQLILYNILLFYGRKKTGFLRAHKRWQPLIPLLTDNILVDSDPGTQDARNGANASGLSWPRGIVIPIETRIRILSIRMLYEVCRVQKLSYDDLKIFKNSFIGYLFDLVEQTRDMEDETFNYSVIKLIVSLNEQFMVALLSANTPSKDKPGTEEKTGHENRVVSVLMRRLGSSRTFGENLIFMLNRAGRSPEDLCMQLLVLKLLYILFTTQGTSEYFYTNDLRVLVDVFLREVLDLDEDSESLRHTYLRVLHPLLTRTQLRSTPYKRSQIKLALESLVGNSTIRDINPTTKRLVERCLGGDWCVQLKKTTPIPSSPVSEFMREDGPEPAPKPDNCLLGPEPVKQKSLKSARSAENLRPQVDGRGGITIRKASTDSSNSLPNVAAASSNSPKHDRSDHMSPTQDLPRHPIRYDSMEMYETASSKTIRSEPDPDSLGNPPRAIPSPSGRRSAPPVPPPVKRRKPPAIPTHRSPRLNGVNGGGKNMTTIGPTITSSPLSQNF